MLTAPRHLNTAELERGLPEVLSSPQAVGQLVAIVVRPAANQRRVVSTARVSITGGIEGDRWIDESPDDTSGQPATCRRHRASLDRPRHRRRSLG